MNNRYKIGNKVKMTRSAAEWILKHPECWRVPSTGELHGYDAPAIDAMATLLGEPPIGIITANGLEQEHYHVKYSKDHTSVYEGGADFYPASSVELAIDLRPGAAKLLKKIAKFAKVDESTVINVLVAHKVVLEGV